MTSLNQALFSSKTEEWQTPKELYDKINNIYPIDLDPCTTKDNPLNTPQFYTKEDNGLEKKWFGNVFVNPPYNREITKWLKKAYSELIIYNNNDNDNDNDNDTPTTKVKNIIFLLPARTDTKWFHEYILKCKEVKYIWFIKGRLKFGNSKNSAPFPSMIVILSHSSK